MRRTTASRFFTRVLPFALATSGAVHAEALDLKTAVERALQSEAQYRAVRAELAAVREESPRALAGLLPQLAASGSRTDNGADIRRPDASGIAQTSRNDYTSESYSITLRQPLLRRDGWVRYQQADTRIAVAEQQTAVERTKLVLQVSESYLSCLYAVAVAQFARSEVDALEGLLASVTRGFAAGASTRTDILDAEARLDNARVRLIEAQQGIDGARRTLESAIGQPVTELRAIAPDRLVLDEGGTRINEWRNAALAANPEIQAARLAVTLARQEIKLQQAGHFPTVDLIGQRQLAESDSVNTLGTRSFTNLWGLQVSIPIFSGGYAVASTRQAAARLKRAQAELDATTERIALHTARTLDALHATSQRVVALRRAEDSARASLVGTEKGLQAGTRSFIDVLNARQQVFEVMQARAQADSQFILELLSLKAAAGQIDDAAVESANELLTREASVRLDRS